MKLLTSRIRSFLLLAALPFLAGCRASKETVKFDTGEPFLGSKGLPIEKEIILEDKMKLIVVKSPRDGSNCIFLLRDDNIILVVSPFGNGQNIDIACRNEPCLSIKQKLESIDVVRTITSHDGKRSFLGYDDAGEVTLRKEMDPQAKQ